jgi:DNA-binding FadR family transcriptional regulator
MSAERKQYERVADVIRDRITRGEFQTRRRIPSQSEMAEEFGVSGNAVWRAIACLRAQGYVWTLPNKGSYARPPEDWKRDRR